MGLFERSSQSQQLSQSGMQSGMDSEIQAGGKNGMESVVSMGMPSGLETERQPAISVRDLQYAYGKGALRKAVLSDISLDVHPGEIVILTGPSGSGKTTLLSLMGGLRSMQTGSLKVMGEELCGASKRKMVEIRSRIGYIFQAHNLLDCLTAQQNVRMSLRLHPEISPEERTKRSVAMLEAVGLGARIDYYPDSLSGGQKQRVAIARALVSQPKLVLADEPTAALDSKSGRDVVEILQRLAKEQGCTILLVTHDNRILDIADRIIHMEDGRLAQNDNAVSPAADPQLPSSVHPSGSQPRSRSHSALEQISA